MTGISAREQDMFSLYEIRSARVSSISVKIQRGTSETSFIALVDMEENKLESKEIDIIVCLLDQLIDSSVPRQAEYYRGYREGIRLIGMVGGEALKGFICGKGMDGSGDPYLENYIRGFNDGCTFHLPDSLENLLGTASAS